METSKNYDLKEIATGYHVQSTVVTASSAPPAPTYYNPDIPPPQHNETHQKIKETCCGIVLLTLIVAFFILQIVDLIISSPNGSTPHHLADFRVNAVSIPSSFNRSSTDAANWNVDFVVDNPTEHKVVYYDPLTVSVNVHNNGLLAGAITNSFVLNWYTTPVTAQFTTPGTILNQVYNSSNGQGSHIIYLDISAVGKLRFGDHGDRYVIRVSCESVMVRYPEGTLDGGPKNCSVQAQAY